MQLSIGINIDENRTRMKWSLHVNNDDVKYHLP